jgi:hypothetical protein
MKAFEELPGLAKQLEAAAALANTEDIQQPLKALHDAALQVSRAFSGSWLGYHSCVYYESFETPPPSTRFSQEWGLRHPEGRRGGWREYSYADVEAHIETLAKHPNLDPARAAARQANELFDKDKLEIISILEIELASHPGDAVLSNLKAELEKLEPMSQSTPSSAAAGPSAASIRHAAVRIISAGFGRLTVNPPMARSDRVATLEEAKAQLKKSWHAWKAWAELVEIE